MDSSSESGGKRAIRNDRVCFSCATPILSHRIMVCPNCHEVNLDDRRTHPSTIFSSPIIRLPPPFDIIGIQKGATILLSGDAGSGKTSICLAAAVEHEMMIEASEQQQKSIAENWRRIHSDKKKKFPRINGCYTWEHLEEDINTLQEGEIVLVDSVSQLAESHESPYLVQKVIERVRTVGAIAFFIAQYTKAGEMLGPNMLRHLVDVVCHIPNDETGLRRLAVDKNRYGGLTARYFSLSASGVGPQVFNQAYSVEGPPGKYRLHLHPLAGAKWAGMLDVLAEAGAHLEGYAGCGIPSLGYKSGYATPPDNTERRAFAEMHGLTWLSTEEACELLAEKSTDDNKEKPAKEVF